MYENNIPESGPDRKKLLCEQMALLAEKSKECEPIIIAEIAKVMAYLETVIRETKQF